MATGTLSPSARVAFSNTFLLGNLIVCTGSIAISAATDTYATGGLAISWPAYNLPGASGAGAKTPIFVAIQSVKGVAYEYDYANSKVLVRSGAAAQTALTEKTNSQALNAGVGPVSDDTITFLALFKKQDL